MRFYAEEHPEFAEGHDGSKLRVAPVGPLPSRPDFTVLNESIPLFFIGRNTDGLWVARESEGRCGGLFLFRSSACRFARLKSAQPGCALMFVAQSFELDLANEGNSFVDLIAKAMRFTKRRISSRRNSLR